MDNYSILYANDGKIYQLGPFDAEAEAIAAAAKAHREDEFDIDDRYVYLLHPDHRMQELDRSDLNLDEESDGPATDEP